MTVFKTAGETVESSSPTSKEVLSASVKRDGCKAPVVAIDPGHNPVETAEFDPITGVAMRDYSNGAEDEDTMQVSLRTKRSLERDGYEVVLLKRSVNENVTYRERVTRAEKAGADIGVSVHTYTDDHRVFPQRVGLFREGVGANGKHTRVEFKNAATAAKSLQYSTAVAKARTQVEGQPVLVTDNSFNGRAPLWPGNIPMIALISEDIPWVYNEFGVPGAGGSVPIGEAGVKTYAEGLTKGIKAALPNTCGN
ncbi:MAG: N-acetylmuramoyl-L-alanine amidase [Gordonia sp. (in: high G+C Gram-positive bacteria)]|uniref:N-acetylmuramoyl-L-alanine amidase n=1 Tax=Gordonia sp. (in: high G+C Gram-positive bacteria) TaxID=84139 RepID=UPI0039E5B4E0